MSVDGGEINDLLPGKKLLGLKEAEERTVERSEHGPAYLRGRRYLDKRRTALRIEPSDKWDQPDGSLTRFSKDGVARRTVAQLAAELGVREDALKDDAKFAAAVHEIVSNCGAGALTTLFCTAIHSRLDRLLGVRRHALIAPGKLDATGEASRSW